MKNNYEDFIDYQFYSTGPFWHLYTPGTNQEIIFHSEEDYKYGITSSAISVDKSVRIIASAIMSNHIHDILAGTEDACINYFERRKAKLMRYSRARGRDIDFNQFNCLTAPINSINSLRNEIAYVNRNGYVVTPGCTPFSYKWSTGMYYYNPAACIGGVPFSKLKYREKRSITHSRIMELPASYLVKDDCIFIPSFINIKEGESWFRDAHQYFNILSKNREAFSEVAKRIGDEVFLTDNELFESLCSYCRKHYGVSKPSSLPPNDKITVAVMMKSELHASKGQIRRMLNLSDNLIRELFP